MAYQALIQNQTLLKAEHAQILKGDALHYLAQNSQKFDIIFCDPPYHKGWLNRLFPILKQHLTEQAMLYVESEYEIKSDSIWQVVKQNKAGNVYYHLLISAA
jgi:16S rRNA (guanine966-N2)-methyltransferase